MHKDIHNYNIAFVNSERWLAKSHVDITQSVNTENFFLYSFFVLYYKKYKTFFHIDIQFYYIVEGEILKNTQWDIFHIFTSEDIDHVTFSNLLLSVKFHNFLLGTISLAALVKYCFHHLKIKVISSRRRVISSIYNTRGWKNTPPSGRRVSTQFPLVLVQLYINTENVL
jgi:hypothetical protein